VIRPGRVAAASAPARKHRDSGGLRMPSILRLFALPAIGWLAATGVAPCSTAAEPPRFSVPAPAEGPLVLVAYGDTRFTEREGVVNAGARRALVERISSERPAAIFIGGDLVYEGHDPADYRTFQTETSAWSAAHIPVFPALGNHEFKGCPPEDPQECLDNWWNTFADPPLRPHRWYSVAIGSNLLALVLDSDSPLRSGSEQRAWFEAQMEGTPDAVKFILIVLHYPPVRDPLFPRARDEREVARYLARHAKLLRARVLVVGSHVHNYERYLKDGVNYVVSGGGGAKPVPAPRMFGEKSHLRTAVNFHYLRLTLSSDRLAASMVRYDAAKVDAPDAWSEPDRFDIRAN
jgi:acid phosphatase type 7